MSILRVVILLVSLSGCAGALAEASPPAWFTDHMRDLVADGGRWVADNSAYRSEQEPFDAYAVEWDWGLGRKSVVGRLYGLSGGEEQGTFWQFRLFWHAGDSQAHAYQWGGNGAVALGTLYPVGEDRIRLEQTLIMEDGSSQRIGHDTVHRDGVQDGESYSIAADGSWQPNRHYVWRLVPR